MSPRAYSEYFMKRKVDVVISLLGLLILSPVFLVIALLIIIDSKGPVFYRQQRIGKGEQPFHIYKFRTMYLNSDTKALITIGSHDNRITQVGYYLRKYKIDEFPQLINVFKGDMSLVGPRPEVQKYTRLYTNDQLDVLSVRPGITDPASILLKDENDLLARSQDPEKFYIEKLLPHKLAINLRYIQQITLKNDLKIIFKTLRVIF